MERQTLTVSGRLLIFTSATLCPYEEKKKDRPIVAGPKMLTGVVLGLAGGPGVKYVQALPTWTRCCPLEKATTGQWEWSLKQG